MDKLTDTGEKFAPAVITSRVAKDHFNHIKSEHARITKGISDQALKVAAYNQTQAVEKEAKKAADANFAKEQMASNLKQQELQIKRDALMM